ncbi:MAG: hypothetical protein ACYC5F_00040 [Thermoleophilia bacterium]
MGNDDIVLSASQLKKTFGNKKRQVEANRALSTGVIYDSRVAEGFIIVPLAVLVLGWATRVYKKTVA